MDITEDLNNYALGAQPLEGGLMAMYSLAELWNITGGSATESPDIWIVSRGNAVLMRLLLSVKIGSEDLYRVVGTEDGKEVYAVLPLMLDYASWVDEVLGKSLKETICKMS